MEPKFKIGDSVWYAGVRCVEKRVLCPDCFGKKFLTVILGDDSQVKIQCVGCAPRMETPQGYVYYQAWEPKIEQVVIDRIEVSQSTVEYGHSRSYRVQEDEISATKEDAGKKASQKMEEHDAEELKRIYIKEKHHKDWAWHVHYFRRRIKSAEKDIEFYEKKLCIAKEKSKESHN